MEKTFRSWDVDQAWLFPPSVRDLVPENHIAHFVRDLVRDELDLRAIHESYSGLRGMPPYHPTMMTALLLYAYSRGVYSSRKIETSCHERVDFMAVTAMSAPDHSTIHAFRQRHEKALSGLFGQVLGLCLRAGLVKLGHVALDGTKVKANASKHKAMSYARMCRAEREYAEIVRGWFERANEIDAVEDAEYGDRRGDEMPDWARTKAGRLAKIREAKARLEAEAKEEAERIAREREAYEKENGRRPGGTPPRALSGKPPDKAQSNFTDPESRIMKMTDGYEQAYNCQVAVDAAHQVIVAQHVVAKQNDGAELIPTLEQLEAEIGTLPEEFSADSNYCSEANLKALDDRGIRGYVATGRRTHDRSTATNNERAHAGERAGEMRRRLRRGGWRSRYRLRKQTVEPVFGQIKEARGFRRFLTRGLKRVGTDWSLICTAHNLLKLFGAIKTRPAIG